MHIEGRWPAGPGTCKRPLKGSAQIPLSNMQISMLSDAAQVEAERELNK